MSVDSNSEVQGVQDPLHGISANVHKNVPESLENPNIFRVNMLSRADLNQTRKDVKQPQGNPSDGFIDFKIYKKMHIKRNIQ